MKIVEIRISTEFMRGKVLVPPGNGEKNTSVVQKTKIPNYFVQAQSFKTPVEENVHFKMEIIGLFHYALTRQADEAVRIKNCKKFEILNSKSQFNNALITRIVIDRKR